MTWQVSVEGAGGEHAHVAADADREGGGGASAGGGGDAMGEARREAMRAAASAAGAPDAPPPSILIGQHEARRGDDVSGSHYLPRSP